MKMNSNKLAFTVKEAREVVPYSHSGFYKLIKENKLKTFKVGGKRLISAKELERFIVEAELAGEV